jgi:hypothetical protein
MPRSKHRRKPGGKAVAHSADPEPNQMDLAHMQTIVIALQILAAA